MIWVVLVLAAVSWLVVTLISEQERGEALSISSRLSARLRGLRKELPRLRAIVAMSSRKALAWLGGVTGAVTRTAGGSASRAFERARASRRRPATMSFRVEPAIIRHTAAERSVRGDGWKSRLVALIELILFVVLISALFAGAIAAAALRIGHLGA
jgi:hypothetical protein